MFIEFVYMFFCLVLQGKIEFGFTLTFLSRIFASEHCIKTLIFFCVEKLKELINC